ncbi:MAG: hypothetical protein JNL60_09600 [Bacteroidia bacterium]|nr:hypothetical protein [Bacteroidia bacterium]
MKVTMLYTRKKQLKGGALYISVLVSIIIGVMLSMFLLLSRYNQRNLTVLSQSSQLYCNLNTALEIAQSAYFTSEMNDTWIKNEFNDDSIRIKRTNWGAYTIVNTRAKNRHQSLSKTGLYGTFMSGDSGLVISDNSRPIGASGKIVFQANCYLPKEGLKPAYIEGQSYIASPGNINYIKKSPRSITGTQKQFISAIEEQVKGPDLMRDSIVGFLPEVYTRSFDQRTVVLNFNGSNLSGLRLAQNIKIYAADLEIDSSCHFEQVVVICNKAHFRKGFRGQVHVIAKDSIVMEEDCWFEFPSSLVLLAGEGKGTDLSFIQFNRGCSLYGAVIAEKGESAQKKVLIKTHAASEISGLLYSCEYLHLEGILNANVYADKLLLKTPSAVYENHLLACEVNPRKYAHLLAVPAIFDNTTRLYNCKTFY